MEWGELGTCDSGAGSLFCHPPELGGVGPPREERAPQQTPLTEPPRLSAPSHLHTPPDPTHRVQARLLAPPSFCLFALFNPRGNMAADAFHVKVVFFPLRAIMDRYGLSDADVVSATPSLPRGNRRGGRLPWGEGGWWRSHCPPPKHHSGVSSRPDPPPPQQKSPPLCC